METAPNKRSYIRLNAIRSLLLGMERTTICQQFCRTDRMVRLWIELFNRGGIDALITRPKGGRKRKVNWSVSAICSYRFWKILPKPVKCTGPG
jgi:transposase